MPVNFCSEVSDILRVVGYFLLVFKIVIPLILLILGMIDLGKAVVSSDDKAVGKAVKSLAMRIVAAICIFFIPNIIGLVLKLASNDENVNKNYTVCAECIQNPGGSGCSGTTDTDNEG